MHIALYRKYRPATFADVVGQEYITTTLRNEIASGTPAHAYLFTGSRGTGKTSCAKIMAKALNCHNPVDGNPCGECDICRGIDDGSVLDVMEIDAASNNGVDNIRDLRDEAGFTPVMGRYRVYIIDEAHMLSTGAFNALLKIMEEPPAHVVFILATTEVHKIPATILSRCQRFDFYRIPRQAVAARLQHIARQEGFTLTEEAAEQIAGLSDGALRDAISLLDLCSSYSSNITGQVALSASGTVGTGHLYDMADAIAEGDTVKVLQTAADLSRKSMDETRLCEQLVGHFRDLMLMRAAGGNALLDQPAGDMERLSSQARRFSLERITYSIRVLQDALTLMGRSTERRMELEVALIKLCDMRLSTQTEALLARIEQLEAALKAGGLAAAPAPKQPAPKEKQSPSAEPLPPEPVAEPAASETREQPLPQWREVLERLERKNPALSGALTGSTAYKKGKYVLIDCRGDLFLKLMRENEYARDCIKQAILEVTGMRCGIGPYQKPKQAQAEAQDPLTHFIENLDLPQDRVQID